MVEINELYFSYGQQEVLRGLSLQMNTGQIHGILGMNGAGKTTLFNILYRRLHPESGSYSFQQKALLPQHIAFQETQSYFYPFLKGREYLDLVALRHPEFDKDAWNELFELPLDQLIDGYSTGMRKKLAFLGIIAMDRPILLLDEPFNGVDIESNEKIFQILLRLRDKGKLIILSSHIIQSLTGIANQIHFLQGGRIEKTYDRELFPQLEEQLKDWIGEKVQGKLDELL